MPNQVSITSDGGNGGDSDAGPPRDTGSFGAVRLFIDGVAVCGGTLITNSCFLTADRCVPADTGIQHIVVAYGRDSDAPDQTRGAAELIRFENNDGSDEKRGRDVMLIGTTEPLVIGGSASGFSQPLMHYREWLPATQSCVGWDLSPQAGSPTNRLHAVSFDPFVTDLDTKTGGRPSGDLVWWLNTTPGEPATGNLPTNNDIGSGCFMTIGQINFATSLNLKVPLLRHDGSDNLSLESRSLGLAEAPIRAWVDEALYGPSDYLPVPALGPVAAAWRSPETLELIGVEKETGALLRFTHSGGRWITAEDLGKPDGVLLSKTLRPGAIWRRSGEAEVLAVSEDGSLWWRRRVEGWLPWEKVAVAKTAIASGIRVAEKVPGHFHVVARDVNGEVRHAEYKSGWLDDWYDVGGPATGEPTLDMPQEGRLNIFFANEAGSYQAYFLGGWQSALWLGPPTDIGSSPDVASSTINWFDMFARSPSGTLTRLAYRAGWDTWLDTGIAMPDSGPFVTARAPGEVDIFASEADGSVWHIAWPRDP